MIDRVRRVIGWGGRLAVVVLAGLTVAAILWAGAEQDRANRAQVLGTVWAVVATASAGGLRWRYRTRRGVAPGPTVQQVAAATEHLATETATFWAEQARQQGITATPPVAVRWQVGPPDLAGPVVDLRVGQDAPAAGAPVWTAPAPHGVPASARLWLPPGPSAPSAPSGPSAPSVGSSAPRPQDPRPLSQGVVTAWYEDLYVNLGPGDVLVVLGRPGSGKSGALLLLLLQALERRDRLPPQVRARARVPVWVTCGSWDPTATTLPEHVADVLARTYPGLTAPAHGGAAGAAAQLQHGRVTVFLDGLDEMPPQLRPVALEAIRSQAARIPVILTSRVEEFRAAVSTGTFHPAGTIELLPVTADTAAAFLQGPRQPGSRTAAWQPVIDHVRARPDGPLGQVLATPLGLCLARDLATDPADLIPASPTTARKVLAGLVGAYLDQAYPATPDRRHHDHALDWLSWTAHHLGAGRDLHWWDPPRWIPRRRLRLARGLTVGLGGGLAAGLGFGLASAPLCGLVYGIGIGTAVGAAAALAVTPYDPPHQAVPHGDLPPVPRGDLPPVPRGRTALRWLRAVGTGCLVGALAVGLALASVFGPAAGLADGLPLGGGIGFLVGTAAGTGTGPGGEPRRVVLRRLPGRQVRAVLSRALGLGLVGVGLGLAFLGVDGLARRPAFGTAGTLALGLAGFAVGLVRGLARAWATSLEDAGVSFPAASYRMHRSTSVLFGAFVGTIVTAVAGVVLGGEYGAGAGAVLGLACGAPVGLASGLTTGIVPGVTFAELALLVHRGDRVRFLALFEDALGRQVLRQAGVAYQFRHAALQDYLAARYESAAGDRTAAIRRPRRGPASP